MKLCKEWKKNGKRRGLTGAVKFGRVEEEKGFLEEIWKS